MKRAAAILAVTVAVVAAILVSLHEYSARQLPDVATPIAKNASLRINDCLSYEVQPSNTTYGELLEKIQKNVGEIDSKIIDLQSAETSKNSAAVKPLLEYLHAGLDVLRAQAMATRKQMESRGAVERAGEAYREYMDSSGYGVEYASKSLGRAKEAVTKSMTEYKDAQETLKTSLNGLTSARNKALQNVPAAVLCDSQIIEKVQQRTAKELESVATFSGGK
jgi:hypothetical protein